VAPGAVPLIPAGKMPIDVHVKPGVAFTAGTFHDLITGANQKTAPRTFESDNLVVILYNNSLLVPKGLPDPFQASQELRIHLMKASKIGIRMVDPTICLRQLSIPPIITTPSVNF
jgi:hypothetical protein